MKYNFERFIHLLSDELREYTPSFFCERELQLIEKYEGLYLGSRREKESMNRIFARSVKVQKRDNAREIRLKERAQKESTMDLESKAKIVMQRIFNKIERVGKEKYTTSMKITTQDTNSYIIFIKGEWIHFSDKFKTKISNYEVFIRRVWSFIKNVALANTEQKVTKVINDSAKDGLLKTSWVKGVLKERGSTENLLQIRNMGRIGWWYDIVRGELSIDIKYTNETTKENVENLKVVAHRLAHVLSIEDFKTITYIKEKKVTTRTMITFYDLHQQEDVVGRYYTFEERMKDPTNTTMYLDMVIHSLTGEKKQGRFWRELIRIHDECKVEGVTLTLEEIEQRAKEASRGGLSFV